MTQQSNFAGGGKGTTKVKRGHTRERNTARTLKSRTGGGLGREKKKGVDKKQEKSGGGKKGENYVLDRQRKLMKRKGQ